MTQISTLAIQKWGNSLAVRIPAIMARSAHCCVGTPVTLTLQDGCILVSPSGERKLTLKERLELFDSKKHGGEVAAAQPIGVEKF